MAPRARTRRRFGRSAQSIATVNVPATSPTSAAREAETSVSRAANTESMTTVTRAPEVTA